MRIPSAQAQKLRDYQNSLFNNPTEPRSERIYVFYLLVRPCLLWLRGRLIKNFHLKNCEAESEMYIFCADLFDNFNYKKSSIVPYLVKYIPWMASKLERKLTRYTLKEIPDGLTVVPEDPYYIQEEYYWKVPNILLTDRYVGKSFTLGEKYFIFKLLTSDKQDLSIQKLAKQCDMDRKTMTLKLRDLKEVLEPWRI